MGAGPAGSVFGENSFYRQTWGTRLGGGSPDDLTWVQYSGKIRFIEKPGVQDKGGSPCG